MSGSSTGMVSKSKNKKFGSKKEFIVENREAGAANIAGTIGIEPNAQLQAKAESSASTGVASEERQQLIAEAAYFRAERRNFVPGYELEDWLEAETEVDMKLTKSGPCSPKDA